MWPAHLLGKHSRSLRVGVESEISDVQMLTFREVNPAETAVEEVARYGTLSVAVPTVWRFCRVAPSSVSLLKPDGFLHCHNHPGDKCVGPLPSDSAVDTQSFGRSESQILPTHFCA